MRQSLSWLSLVVPLACALVPSAPAPAGAQVDHLECYAIKDAATRAKYRADVDGLARASGCRVKARSRLLCVPTTTAGVSPMPPGGGLAGGTASLFVCYDVRCPRIVLDPVPVVDRFGDRTVTPRRPKLICAPAEVMGSGATASEAGGGAGAMANGREVRQAREAQEARAAQQARDAGADLDHLACYQVRDPLPRTTYRIDLAGLAPEAGCSLKTPGNLLCVAASKSGVVPEPPGGGPSGGLAGTFACYATRCPRANLADLVVTDQFRSRTVTPRRTKQLCAPVRTTWTVDAGSLKLRVDRDPWRLRFFDRDGLPVLEEHPGTTTAPTGTLALHLGPPPAGNGDAQVLPPVVDDEPPTPPERDTSWMHATRLLDERFEDGAWVATVATTDPGGRTLTVRAAAEADGVIALTVTPSAPVGVQALGVGFVADGSERFLGFGERSNRVDQRGRAVEHYVGEGPYQDEEYPFITGVVPKWGIRWREDATYFPIPWLLSSRGYGVLLDNDALSYHRLASETPDAWSMEVEETEMRFRVFAGPTPADVLRRFTRATGVQPRPYAPWFFGPWIQPDTDDRIRALREADVPTSVTATFLHYLPCGDQQGQEAQQPIRTAALNAQGTAVHTYFNPMICTDYQPAYAQAQAAGALLQDRSGADYVFPYTTTEVFTVSEFDLSAPAGIAFYGTLLREALDDGYEGWMEDFGEYVPLDAVAADGATGTRLHNRHPRDYHCGAQAALADVGRPLARFARSGWTGSAACSPIVWGGDPTTNFGFDGLESSIYQALSMGLSGVGVWGSDIGGFFALGNHRLTPENLDRWVQFGAFSPVMRTQRNGIAVPSKTRPQVWEAAHLAHWRRYAKLHTQLWPYVQAALEEYYATGLPLMRHGALTHPDDPQAMARHDQYHFGPSLLVAPVYVDGARERTLHLPLGAWVEWWRAVGYDETDGSFRLTGGSVLDGGRAVTVAAPLEEIPVLVAAGSVLALLPPDVQTLADHGTDPAIVHLADRADQLHLLAFPRGATTSRFYAGETLRSVEEPGAWRLTVDGARAYTVELEAALGTLAVPFVPCTVELSQGTLERWDYEPAGRILRARFRTDGGMLTVRTGGCVP